MNRYQRQKYRNAYQTPQTSENVPFKRHLYRGRTLAILIGAYITSWIFIFGDPALWNSVNTPTKNTSPALLAFSGVLGLFCVVVAVLIIDWRGFSTMNGWIKWGKMKMWQRIVLGYLYLEPIPIGPQHGK